MEPPLLIFNDLLAFIVIWLLLHFVLWFIWNNCICPLPATYTRMARNYRMLPVYLNTLLIKDNSMQHVTWTKCCCEGILSLIVGGVLVLSTQMTITFLSFAPFIPISIGIVFSVLWCQVKDVFCKMKVEQNSRCPIDNSVTCSCDIILRAVNGTGEDLV